MFLLPDAAVDAAQRTILRNHLRGIVVVRFDVQVTGDEVLARWVMDLGAGVVWRPREMKDVARTLPLARYYLPPEWLTVS